MEARCFRYQMWASKVSHGRLWQLWNDETLRSQIYESPSVYYTLKCIHSNLLKTLGRLLGPTLTQICWVDQKNCSGFWYDLIEKPEQLFLANPIYKFVYLCLMSVCVCVYIYIMYIYYIHAGFVIMKVIHEYCKKWNITEVFKVHVKSPFSVGAWEPAHTSSRELTVHISFLQ